MVNLGPITPGLWLSARVGQKDAGPSFLGLVRIEPPGNVDKLRSCFVAFVHITLTHLPAAGGTAPLLVNVT